MARLPLLLGHRGARVSTGTPENTFASFDLALEHDCDGFEFDVRLAACGTAVVCHDPKVGKLAIASITFASSWTWIDHSVSGLFLATRRPFRTRFRYGYVCST